MATVIGVLLAACGGGADSPTAAAPGGRSPADPTGDVDPTEPGEGIADAEACTPVTDLPGGDVAEAPPTDAPFPWDREDPPVLAGFDPDAIIPGGPPPDGILPIDSPCVEGVAAAGTWLQPQSPVMVVEVDGDRRAYPLAILTQHEIVNDVVGGVPVVVTYCPLCNSGLAFERTLDGDVHDFGTSGRLFQSNLVMYDRQTRTLWSQFTGEAVVGDLVGVSLERIPSSLLSWDAFVEGAPDGLVLSRDSVPGRDYGRNPYPGYEGAGDGFLFQGPRDDRLPPNTRVVGLGADTDPVAVPLAVLRDAGVVEVEVDGDPVTLWWAPGQSSALDAATVSDGIDVGSTAAFLPTLEDGTVLRFDAAQADDRPGQGGAGARVTDQQTGSTWNLLGEAVDGPLTGTVLRPVPREDTFWFVWFAFQPDTEVADG